MKKPRILFVDDEQNVLDGLRRMMRAYREQFDSEFASSGGQALAMAGEKTYDVLVTDMRMPGMDGAELLRRFKERCPRTVRVVLSGHAEQDTALAAVRLTHQYLAKPSDRESLYATLAWAVSLRAILKSDQLQSVVAAVETLPVLPESHQKLVAALHSPVSSLSEIGDLIAGDPGMTAKVLQMVNSAFFGLPTKVVDPAAAVSMLGFETVSALALMLHVFDQFGSPLLKRLRMERFWEHSAKVAADCKRLGMALGFSDKELEAVRVAGMLHDVGKLVLAGNLEQEYMAALNLAHDQQLPSWEAERAIFGADHGQVGAFLLGLWNLPSQIVTAVAWHHHPNLAGATVSRNTAVLCLADFYDHYGSGVTRQSIAPEVREVISAALEREDAVTEFFPRPPEEDDDTHG